MDGNIVLTDWFKVLNVCRHTIRVDWGLVLEQQKRGVRGLGLAGVCVAQRAACEWFSRGFEVAAWDVITKVSVASE